jgi:hypothetical protein
MKDAGEGSGPELRCKLMKRRSGFEDRYPASSSRES